MPRLVKKTAQAPVLVGDKHICMCGLSKEQPFCDRSHLKTKDEEADKLYWYEGEAREEIVAVADECHECSGNCCHEE